MLSVFNFQSVLHSPLPDWERVNEPGDLELRMVVNDPDYGDCVKILFDKSSHARVYSEHDDALILVEEQAHLPQTAAKSRGKRVPLLS